MTIDEAIANRERCLKYLIRCKANADPESLEAVRMSISALRAKQESENNEPLTLDDLLKMSGEPVWAIWGSVCKGEWFIVFPEFDRLENPWKVIPFSAVAIGRCTVYRRHPETK